VLNHTRLVGLVLIGTIVLNVWMYITIPTTFFPEQDTGALTYTHLRAHQTSNRITYPVFCMKKDGGGGGGGGGAGGGGGGGGGGAGGGGGGGGPGGGGGGG
ncbi:efflux RND transporter permease subunit, partial [Enterobacter hormaechei]